jgi:hypothetical protein
MIAVIPIININVIEHSQYVRKNLCKLEKKKFHVFLYYF